MQINIVEDNYSGKEGSFVYNLHEKSIFDKTAFWLYYESIIQLSQNDIENKNEIILKIFKTYSYILKCFIYHSSKYDGYKIKGINDREVGKYVERLESVIFGFTDGYKINEANFDDGLTPIVNNCK